MDGVSLGLFYGHLCGLQELHPECVLCWKLFVKGFADFFFALRCEVGSVWVIQRDDLLAYDFADDTSSTYASAKSYANLYALIFSLQS